MILSPFSWRFSFLSNQRYAVISSDVLRQSTALSQYTSDIMTDSML